MLQKAGSIFAQWLQRVMPEPFVFAIILTILMALPAILFTKAGIAGTFDAWYRGFWMLLEFGMQAVLLLATGYAIALSPLVSRLIDKLAKTVRSPNSVYLMVIIIGSLFSLVSWGWAVLTAILAREMAKRVDGLDYPFLVACVYLSAQPWVAGVSSSIPLLLATENNFLIQSGVLESTIGTTKTLGSALNTLYLAVFFLTMPFIMWLMKPAEGEVTSMQALGDSRYQEQGAVKEEAESYIQSELSTTSGETLSDRLNHGAVLPSIIVFAALAVVIRHFVLKGQGLDLNIMIFIFIASGLALHSTPMRYIIAMKRACGNVSGIVFQYPFYGGIMGIMMFTGLGSTVSQWLVSNATISTLPVIAQFSGALINFAVPSAGGEWAVIGPAFVEAAQSIAQTLPPAQQESFIARIAMSVAYGETSSNLLQPFFILVILPVMGAGVRIQARDVMGYLVIPFLVLSLAIALLVSLLPL